MTSNSYVSLADICDAIVDCEHKTAPTQPSGIPSIRTSDINSGRLDLAGANRVSEETYKEWTRRLEPCPGDLILAREAPVGQVGIVPPDAKVCLGQRTVLIRPNRDRLLSHYLLYLLLTPAMQHAMLSKASGSTVPHLNMSDIRALEIPHPPSLKEQERRVFLLSALDEKMELNREMNETLEGIARAIFKSWFVDFDPVWAKVEGHEYPLDEETLRLFPNGFEESEIGDIPIGWKSSTLDDFLDVLGGGTPRTSVSEYWDGDIPWFSVKDTPAGSDVFVIDTERKISQLGVENSSAKMLSEGTTIITARGTVGNLALTGVPMSMNQSCYAIQGKDGYPAYFTYYVVKSHVSELQKKTHGTVFDTITTRTFSTIVAPLPPVSLARAFQRIVKPFLEKIRLNLFESRTLAETRDTLLPKLITGELRVPKTETVPALEI